MGAATDDLALAIAATRHSPGPARMSSWVRRDGSDAFTANIDRLDSDSTKSVFDEAAELEACGIVAIKLGDAAYPEQLATTGRPPAVLFCSGPEHLLDKAGIGICGSRSASDPGLRAAFCSGELSVRFGLTVVSGYAKGVDTAAHLAALSGGGETVIVLPEGIMNFRVRQRDFAGCWDPGRALVVSQFAPSQPWRAANAMARNSTIIGLSSALVVVEAGRTGGTLAAGRTALSLGRRALVLDFAEQTPGNAILLEEGAIPVHDRTELAELLDHLRISDEPIIGSESTGRITSLF